MNPVIEYLKDQNILGKTGPVVKTINSLSLNKFVSIAENIENITKKHHQPASNTIFSHSASSNLGGGSTECQFVDCRIERITCLARFAVLYSDKVFIDNFLTDYTGIDDRSILDEAKNRFIDDLIVLNTIKPIIEQGYVDFFASEKNVCFTCQAKMFLGDKAGIKFINAYNSLKKDYLIKMSVDVTLSPESIDFKCYGPSPFFDHERIMSSDYIPEIIVKSPHILNKLKKGYNISCSKTLIKRLNLNVEFAHQIVSDSIFGAATSSSLKTSFLTDHDLQIQFLNNLQNDYDISRRNQIAEKYLTTMVPFLEEIKLSDLSKIRKREAEAFILFRKSINDTIGTALSSSGRFSEKDAKNIYSDIIYPSLANLEIKVKNAKKDLIKKPLRSIIGIAGVMSFGLLTGIIPQNLSDIMKILGLYKFGTDLIKDSLAIADGKKEILNDNYYFLWKIKKQ